MILAHRIEPNGKQDPRSVQDVTLAIPQWLLLRCCEVIFIAYYLSLWRYKTWYIATAVVLIVVGLEMAAGWLRLRGAVTAILPVALYFFYLFLAAGWSEFPATARLWTVADSIGIPIAFIAWLLLRNVPAAMVADFFVRIGLIGAVIGFVQLLSLPPESFASRAGGFATVVNPFTVSFCWADIVYGRNRRRAVLSLVMTFAIMAVGRSRTPAAASVVALLLSMIFIGRGLLQRLKATIVTALLLSLSIVGLMMLATTRKMIVTTVVRFTGQSRIVDSYFIPAEPDDIDRQNLDDYFKENVWEVQPFGIGYLNMIPLYERRWGREMSLHSIYQTWLLEGGIFCALIVAFILVRHFTALSYAMRRAASQELRLFARCTVIASVTVLGQGMFHQMHRTPIFFAALGLGIAARQRARDRYFARPFLVERESLPLISPQTEGQS